jgi:hypothetical protein
LEQLLPFLRRLEVNLIDPTIPQASSSIEWLFYISRPFSLLSHTPFRVVEKRSGWVQRSLCQNHGKKKEEDEKTPSQTDETKKDERRRRTGKTTPTARLFFFFFCLGTAPLCSNFLAGTTRSDV